MVRQAYCREPVLPWGFARRHSHGASLPPGAGTALPSRPVAEMTDDSTDGPTDQALWDLLDAERHRAQVEDRRRRRNRRLQADESVSFTEVLGALAAHGTVVDVATATGTLAAVVVCEVGRDYVAVRSGDGLVRLVPFPAVASAAAVGRARSGPPAGLVGPTPLHLAERLRELAGWRTSVQVTTAWSVVSGQLRRVGADVIVVEQADGGDAFVALPAVVEVGVEP